MISAYEIHKKDRLRAKIQVDTAAFESTYGKIETLPIVSRGLKKQTMEENRTAIKQSTFNGRRLRKPK